MANDFQAERLSDFGAVENANDFEPNDFDDFREEWREVVGYEGWYEVSDLGRIRSCDREITYRNGRVFRRRSRLIRLNPRADGYITVLLCRNGSRRYFTVHRIVARAFLSNPDNLPIVNHKDGNKANNAVSNLEWCTSEYNNVHAFKMGLNKGRKRRT